MLRGSEHRRDDFLMDRGLMECPRRLEHHAEAPNGPLRGEEVLVLLTYMVSILLLVAGPSYLFQSHFSHPPWFLDKAVYAPLFGLFFLVIASLCYSRRSVVEAAMIREVISEKSGIIVLILSFAHLSISMDMSGFFKESALAMIRAAKGNGVRLLVYLYLMCSFLTYFTSNDIVIISMTPIVVHTCSEGIQDCVPLLITQFIAANTASIGLLLSSPSNLILGDAVGLSFLQYWYLMLLPTFVAVTSTLAMVLLIFVYRPLRGHAMQRKFDHPTHTHAMGRQSPVEAATGRDTEREVASSSPRVVETLGEGDRPRTPLSQRSEEEGVGSGREGQAGVGVELVDLGEGVGGEGQGTQEQEQVQTLLYHPRVRRLKVVSFFFILVLCCLSDVLQLQLWAVALVASLLFLLTDMAITAHEKRNVLSFLYAVYLRMPWAIAPFVVAMFLLVQALSKTGFVDRFAHWMLSAAGASFLQQSLVFGLTSALLVNVLNDLPATVFWALMTPSLCGHYTGASADGRAHYTGVIMALLVGVNPGCYLTIIGALAGLMWRNIIATQPNVHRLQVPSAWDLTFYGGIVLGPVTLLTCMAVAIVAPYV